MDESVICIGEVQGHNSVQRQVLGESGREIPRGPSGDSAKRKHCLRSHRRKQCKCKSKENLAPVAIVDLTKEPKPVRPPTDAPEQQANNQPECPLCFESLLHVDVRVTDCGHLFCRSCMDKVIAMNGPKCPKCRQILNRNLVRPVYF